MCARLLAMALQLPAAELWIQPSLFLSEQIGQDGKDKQLVLGLDDNLTEYVDQCTSPVRVLENVGLLLNGNGDMVTKTKEKAKKDLDRLEKWANRNLMRFREGNVKSSTWG
ncbi:hypothetical protein QYF61_019211 [Mycteria americana]|uniref:Rna-directed dna polymerase from mobile element jockey-like n=1 Tax=Mycteria americana TaxID=33587 RepID=A0AAN7P0Q5_MYCAM|nr:hypothetical protein QYF61_019211 [Mycteria americana]